MSEASREQRNPYKGEPPRAWVRVTFERADGNGTVQKDLVADTGCPAEAVISADNMEQLKLADGPSENTNFGPAEGGWTCISMPDLGLEK